MSHIATYRTEITKADPAILERAVDFMCEHMDCKRVGEIHGFGRSYSPSGVGVIQEGMRYDADLVIEGGALSIHGDEYRQKEQFARFRKQVYQVYKAVAMQTALERLNYQTDAVYQPTKKIRVVAQRTPCIG